MLKIQNENFAETPDNNSDNKHPDILLLCTIERNIQLK